MKESDHDNYLSEGYLQFIRGWLIARRESKEQILKTGGSRSLGHSRSDIVRIDFALKRIEQGQFGICAHCGTIIEQKRIEIIPETPFYSFCVKEISE
ncbi:MAG: hypothetical protein IPN70_05410 [Candidatus Moraniibacteriota bacterium]|nr:MAG: hypothetical protein IPN70_05410 [Candidatus Moranbacteria bacterium]